MMSDSLAAINVDQLSNAVNAVVNGQQQGQQSLNVTSSVAQVGSDFEVQLFK